MLIPENNVSRRQPKLSQLGNVADGRTWTAAAVVVFPLGCSSSPKSERDFGSGEYVIQVYPVKEGQQVQTRVFKTGRWFSSQDMIPRRLYFDLNNRSERFSVDVPASNNDQPKESQP